MSDIPFSESAKWQLCTIYMFEDDGCPDRKEMTVQKYVSDFVEKNSHAVPLPSRRYSRNHPTESQGSLMPPFLEIRHIDIGGASEHRLSFQSFLVNVAKDVVFWAGAKRRPLAHQPAAARHGGKILRWHSG